MDHFDSAQIWLSLSYSFPLKHRLQKFIGSKKYKLENNLVQLQNFH